MHFENPSLARDVLLKQQKRLRHEDRHNSKVKDSCMCCQPNACYTRFHLDKDEYFNTINNACRYSAILTIDRATCNVEYTKKNTW
ncbi:hypothetical protein RRG08_059286 [Elysia crispata]|uniref:Uncharacterized protein n=1 Tax=Elysia crispata TaxID=231223 RepID=A0AAE1B0E8_9GAST|nr:hypothetical protein RRG08_059286 [Elysia crispata]